MCAPKRPILHGLGFGFKGKYKAGVSHDERV